MSTSSGGLSSFGAKLLRRKPLDLSTITPLDRCLGLIDLVALGVGSTLGLGLYVLAGQVASNRAGPAVIVSFLLAASASALSAICYAEFAGLVPRAGSAYAYSYITVGELVAFVIGWNMVLEYVIGAASVARGFSGYLWSMIERVGAVSPLTATPLEPLVPGNVIPPVLPFIGISGLEHGIGNFDWLSLIIIGTVTLLMMFSVRESSKFTLIFTGVNLLVVVVTIVASLTQITDLRNWRLTEAQVPPGAGTGGFMPFGWAGVVAGSATCFFGFIGFDTIASSAEEAIEPQRTVPRAILISLLISFLAYFGVATVQTLVWPYYDQDKVAVLPYIFDSLQMPVAYWLVLCGALAGLASSQCGAIYPLPRTLYSMARDRLIYGPLAVINRRLKLPVRATIVGSTLIACLACSLNIEQLADMVSIGTLAAYSLVSVSVLILRYEPPVHKLRLLSATQYDQQYRSDSLASKRYIMCAIVVIVALDTFIYAIVSLELTPALSNISTICSGPIMVGAAVSIALIALTVIMWLMSRLPTYSHHVDVDRAQKKNERQHEPFRVPLVPLIPLSSIAINVFLMLNLSSATWIRFAIWMSVGFFIYFTYGIWNSRGYLTPELDMDCVDHELSDTNSSIDINTEGASNVEKKASISVA